MDVILFNVLLHSSLLQSMGGFKEELLGHMYTSYPLLDLMYDFPFPFTLMHFFPLQVLMREILL